MTSLETYLRNLPDRCVGCGYAKVQGCHCPGGEYAIFTAAIKSAAREDGTVHQADVRPLIRGRIPPKTIGSLYRRAKAEGVLRDTGDREPSNDAAGRNLDKLDRIYAVGRGVAA